MPATETVLLVSTLRILELQGVFASKLGCNVLQDITK
jgi:hypothetical protein